MTAAADVIAGSTAAVTLTPRLRFTRQPGREAASRLASRQRLPSCSLVRLRVSAGSSSIVTSTTGLARLWAGPVGTLPAPTIGWSPIAADTCRK